MTECVWSDGGQTFDPLNVSLQLQPADIHMKQLEPKAWKERITQRKRRLTGALVKNTLIEWLVRFESFNCWAAERETERERERDWTQYAKSAVLPAPPAGCRTHHSYSVNKLHLSASRPTSSVWNTKLVLSVALEKRHGSQSEAVKVLLRKVASIAMFCINYEANFKQTFEILQKRKC